MEACKEAVNRIIQKHKDLTGLQCCFLAIDKQGNVGAYSDYNGFNYALRTNTEEKMVDAGFDRSW
jgi:isoaspartyl peptidase/L-asparaginase-like protein (Ntn-hydrolase superfamily)